MCKARVRLAAVQSRSERKIVRDYVVIRSVGKLRRASIPSVAFVPVRVDIMGGSILAVGIYITVQQIYLSQ